MKRIDAIKNGTLQKIDDHFIKLRNRNWNDLNELHNEVMKNPTVAIDSWIRSTINELGLENFYTDYDDPMGFFLELTTHYSHRFEDLCEQCFPNS